MTAMCVPSRRAGGSRRLGSGSRHRGQTGARAIARPLAMHRRTELDWLRVVAIAILVLSRTHRDAFLARWRGYGRTTR